MELDINRIGKKFISDALLRLNLEFKKYTFSINPRQDFGDYSTNVAFLYSRDLRKKPSDVAKIIVNEISNNSELADYFDSIIPEENGYINFWISKCYLSENITYINYKARPFFGFLKADNEKYIIDFSSPNMVKSFTVGYLRSTIIGDAVSNIFSYSGKNIIRDNYLGDWGVPFGKIICAVEKYSSLSKIIKMKDPYGEILRLYKFFLKEEIVDSRLTKRAENYFLKLESGDKEIILIWKNIRSILHNGLLNIYSLLNISFDTFSWESDVKDSVHPLINKLIKDGIAQVSDGAVIVDMEKYNLSTIVLRKQNGSALYGARELSTDKARMIKYGNDIIIINEVGSDQKIYLKQIYLIEKTLGWFSKEQRYHLSHGMYRLEGMKMDSEKKNYLDLVNVVRHISKKYQLRYKITEEDAVNLVLGAMRLHDFKNPHINNIDFNFDIFFNNSIDTIFYVQGLMKKLSKVVFTISLANKSFKIDECSILDLSLCRKLQKFPEILKSCVNGIQCTKLTQYALELLVLLEDVLKENIFTDSRNHLLISTDKILNICFNLLGIKIIKNKSTFI